MASSDIKYNKKNSEMGNYIQENLIKDEQIEFETTYHWIIFCNLRAIFTLFIAPMLDRYSDEFAITNKRIIVKTGFISRKTLEMNLSKIESVNVDQSILGRMLGYGTIRIIRCNFNPLIFLPLLCVLLYSFQTSNNRFDYPFRFFRTFYLD